MWNASLLVLNNCRLVILNISKLTTFFSLIFKTCFWMMLRGILTAAQYTQNYFPMYSFCSCVYGRFAEAGKRRITAVHLLEKSAINMIWLLLIPVSDWSIIMIGPGGLLLVVPTYLQFPPFQFFGSGGAANKVNNETWMWENIVAGGHLLGTGGDAL